MKIEHQINEQIYDREVRVIGPDGEQLGVMSASEANKIADEHELDLVKISPNAVPPVCKIMDYGKFRFDQMKKEKEAKKNQKIVETKEIRLSMTIENHDMETKAKNANKFLQNGDKVKVSLRMKGRQNAYAVKGIEIVKGFCDRLSEFGQMDKQPAVEGKNIIVMVLPIAKK